MSMTDEQIVKAFKICNSENLGCEDDCPFIEICKKDNGKLYRAIIDLIERQRVEIERFADIGKMYSEVRAEVVREFAERLKDVFVTIDGTFECWEIEEHIDELVREMTEKEGGKG